MSPSSRTRKKKPLWRGRGALIPSNGFSTQRSGMHLFNLWCCFIKKHSSYLCIPASASRHTCSPAGAQSCLTGESRGQSRYSEESTEAFSRKAGGDAEIQHGAGRAPGCPALPLNGVRARQRERGRASSSLLLGKSFPLNIDMS